MESFKLKSNCYFCYWSLNHEQFPTWTSGHHKQSSSLIRLKSQLVQVSWSQIPYWPGRDCRYSPEPVIIEIPRGEEQACSDSGIVTSVRPGSKPWTIARTIPCRDRQDGFQPGLTHSPKSPNPTKLTALTGLK